MPVTHQAQDQIQKIDQQIINLLVQREKYWQDAMDEQEEGGAGEFAGDILAAWESAADERGWNIAAAAKAGRALNELCRSGGE